MQHLSGKGKLTKKKLLVETFVYKNGDDVTCIQSPSTTTTNYTKRTNTKMRAAILRKGKGDASFAL